MILEHRVVLQPLQGHLGTSLFRGYVKLLGCIRKKQHDKNNKFQRPRSCFPCEENNAYNKYIYICHVCIYINTYLQRENKTNFANKDNHTARTVVDGTILSYHSPFDLYGVHQLYGCFPK